MTIDEIKKRLLNSIEKIKNLNDFFNSLGIDCINYRQLNIRSYIEIPTRIYKATINGCYIKAFSYFGRDVYIHDCEVGRYCSIAKSVNIGQGNHPISWLSSNPFQYQQSFRIRTGELFKFNTEYHEYYVPDTLRGKVKQEIYKPKTKIGNDVWIGVGVMVLPGITIGNGAVIGAGSIVTKDIPPYAVAVGNPAKVIKYRFEKDIIERLQQLQWWDYAPWDLHKYSIDFSNVENALDEIETRIQSGELKKYETEKLSVKELIELFNEYSAGTLKV